MLLNVNFNDIPDKIPPIGQGIRTFRIKSVEVKEKTRKDQQGVETKDTVLGCVLEINEEGNVDQGRPAFLDPSVNDTKGKVMIKRLALSAGVRFNEQGGFDTTELVGKVVAGAVTHSDSAEKNKETGHPTGRVVTYANVREFLIPGDPGFPQG